MRDYVADSLLGKWAKKVPKNQDNIYADTINKINGNKNNYNDNDSAPNSGDIYRYPHNPCYSYNAGNTVIRDHHG